MFNVGERVLDKNGKIYLIESEELKDFGVGPSSFLVLRPVYEYDFSENYRCYIPKDRSENLLYHLMDKDDAIQLIDSIPQLEILPESTPRERKALFQTYIATADRTSICRAIKTLMHYKEERKAIAKPFSDFDNRLLYSLINLLSDEMSISLSIPRNEVDQFISNRINK